MSYNANMIARAEHNLRVRSLPPVPEYGYHLAERKRTERRFPVLLLRPILAALLHLVTK